MTLAAKVFVSYAHVDNSDLDDVLHKDDLEEKGWISYSVGYLEDCLDRCLGRSDYYQLWFDQNKLRGNHRVTPELKKEVESSDTLIVMMSKGWVESTWCQQELRLFLESHSETDNRIFVLNLDNTPRDSLPTEIRDLVSYSFFQETNTLAAKRLGDPIPTLEDILYFDTVFNVAQDLGAVLEEVNANREKPVATSTSSSQDSLPSSNSITTVFVSLVSSNLDSHRKFIINNLAQKNIRALPAKNSNSEATEVDLSSCELLIQLLDDDPLVDLPANDFLEATTQGIKIIQWCEPSLDISKVKSEEQRKLLQSQYLVKSSLPDFSEQINKLLFPKKINKGEVEKSVDHIIFVHTGQEDWSVAQGIANKLSEQGYGTVLPRYDENPITINNSINRGLEVCDVMLMLHQKTPADVVDEYLKEAWLKLKKVSGDPTPEIVVCSCSCVEEELLVHLPGTRVLDCNNDFGKNCIEQFMDGIS